MSERKVIENKYIDAISYKELYKYVQQQLLWKQKASHTENQIKVLINNIVATKLEIEYGEACKEDLTFKRDEIKVMINRQNETIYPINLYTYVLMCGCYVPPWNWFYESETKGYYDRATDRTHYFDQKTKLFDTINGRLHGQHIFNYSGLQ